MGWTKTSENTYTNDRGQSWTKTSDSTWTSWKGDTVTETNDNHWKVTSITDADESEFIPFLSDEIW